VTLLTWPSAKHSLSMEQSTRNRLLLLYELAAAILWAGILIAVAVVLQGTPYFGQLLPILSGGAAFFVVILPYSLAYELSRLSKR